MRLVKQFFISLKVLMDLKHPLQWSMLSLSLLPAFVRSHRKSQHFPLPEHPLHLLRGG